MSVSELAKSTVGKIKYSFGANNINSNGTGTADCSSFTEWLFKQYGVNIGRNTESQYSQGTKVNKNDLQEGDLIFFKNTYNSGYTDGVSHVGVYIGNGKFVHNSSGAGKTVISSLDSAYYKNHYLGARRIDVSSTDNKTEGITVTPTKTSVETSDNKEEVKDLKWWGDLIVIVLCILLIGLAVVFFISAFNGSIPNPLNKVKNLIK